MPARRWLHRGGLAVFSAALVIALLSLAFRGLIWASWPPHPGDPYGASDLLDLLLVALVLLLAGLSFLLGLGLLFARPRQPTLPLAGLPLLLVFLWLREQVPG